MQSNRLHASHEDSLIGTGTHDRVDVSKILHSHYTDDADGGENARMDQSSVSSGVRMDAWGGKILSLSALSAWAKLFLFTAIVQVCIVISITIMRLSVIPFPLSDDTRADFTYAMVLLINTIFSCYYAVHSCLRERRVEMIAFCSASLIVTTYVVYQFAYIGNSEEDKHTYGDWQDARLTRFILTCIFEPISIALAVKVQSDFGWVTFKTVGANAAMVEMHRVYSICMAFIKFDLQLNLSLAVLAIFSRLSLDFETGVDSAALLFSIVYMLYAWSVIRYENERGMKYLNIFSNLQPGYVGFKLWRIFDNPLNLSAFAKWAIFGACILSLLMRTALVVVQMLAHKNFHKGLKERMNEVHNEKHRHLQESTRYAGDRDPLLSHAHTRK